MRSVKLTDDTREKIGNFLLKCGSPYTLPGTVELDENDNVLIYGCNMGNFTDLSALIYELTILETAIEAVTGIELTLYGGDEYEQE